MTEATAGSTAATARNSPGSRRGRGPTVVFLPGFRSDMAGDKATALPRSAPSAGQAMLRFDYSGHGASGGDFMDGTIGAWAADALAAIDRADHGAS